MRQKRLWMLALLCAVAQGAWADEVTTVLDDGVFTGFTATGYIMTTGGDTQSYSGRNPKSWTIKAKAHAEDDWTTLVTVENDATMPAKTS